MALIYNNTDKFLTPHFRESEFFTNSPDFKGHCHFLDDSLISACEAIRLFSQTPVYITSTYRTVLDNISCGGSKKSCHLRGLAIDFACPLRHAILVEAITTHSELYFQLRKIGINGFGLGKDFIHIDCRQVPPTASNSLGNPVIWTY